MSKRGLDIASLTPEERLRLPEELWDSPVRPEHMNPYGVLHGGLV